MAWFREGRRRGRLEVVYVEAFERRALLLGELDEAVLARAAASRAARALARALVVRPLVVGQALGPGRPALEARRAAALGLGHILLGPPRLRRRLRRVLFHVAAAAVGVEADRQHELFIALDALVALELVLGLGRRGDDVLLDVHGLLGGRLGRGGFLGGGHGCEGLRWAVGVILYR